MATFRLFPCKMRDGWLVPKKGEQSVEMDWKQLCATLAPSRSIQALRTLRLGLQPSAYVGLIKQSNGVTTNFVVRNPDLSGDVRRMLQRDPTVASRLVAVYRVDFVSWDDRMVEGATMKASAL